MAVAEDAPSRSSAEDSEAKDHQDEYIDVCLADIKKEMQCPICLSVIKKTRTVMECLHRFCRECIDKAMRIGNNECPACRVHCASRRSLRDDPKFDNLVAALYPDLDKYEEEEDGFDEEESRRNRQIQERISETFRRQITAFSKRKSAGSSGGRAVGRKRPLRGLKRGRSLLDDEEKEDDDAEEALLPEERRRTGGSKRVRTRRLDPDFITESPEFSAEEEESDLEANAAEDAALEDVHIDRAGGGQRREREETDARMRVEENEDEKFRARTRQEHFRRADDLVANANERNARDGEVQGWTPSSFGVGRTALTTKCYKAALLRDFLLARSEERNELEVHISLNPADDGHAMDDGEECLPPMECSHLCCPAAITVGHLCKFLESCLSLDADELELLLPTIHSVDPSDNSTSHSSSTAELLPRGLTLRDIAMSRWKLRGNPVLLYRLKP